MRKKKWKKNFKIVLSILLITCFVALGLNMFGGISTVAQAIGAGYQFPAAG